MTAHDIEQMVHRLIGEYSYALPGPGTTIGTPWSEERIAGYIEQLKQSLVFPRLEQFSLAETYEQTIASSTARTEYWVVAERDGYFEWYDPATDEFGLGQKDASGSGLVSIGVRGDLVGVFCAM